MRLALLAGGSSVHTVRWANGLVAAGIDVHLITQHPILSGLRKDVEVHLLPYAGMLGYYLNARRVRKILVGLAPDLVNAHYASGYGTTARLANYRPWLLSLWGSDVYLFPRKSFIHRALIAKNLGAADAIASTSNCMAREALRLLPDAREISITPFGVETDKFSGRKVERNPNYDLVIGTVKSLKHVYGVDLLLKAFARLIELLDGRKRVGLRIVGEGPKRLELEKLAASLGIAGQVEFVGGVPHPEVPEELSKLDIYVALSRSESFGVAAIEAGASGLPVVVSNADGLAEVVVDRRTGIIVPNEDVEAAALGLLELVMDGQLRQDLGISAQRHVQEKYSWTSSVETMLRVYERTCGRR